MKAFLLAAGLGTRLRPLTETIPKCLVRVSGRPLLFHWLDLLEREKVREVLINTHYHSPAILDAIASFRTNLKIEVFHEPQLLGSAGTVARNREFVKGEEDFFVVYADNLTNVSLSVLLKFHQSRPSLFSTYLYETNTPTQKGIVVIERETGKVLEFQEKPSQPKSNLAHAGISVVNKKIFEFMADKVPLDFGFDVMPRLIGVMYALKAGGYIRDIGTLRDLQEANTEWERLPGVQG